MIATIRATEHNDLPTLAKFLVFVYQFGPSDHHADPQLLEWTYLRASPLREGSRSYVLERDGAEHGALRYLPVTFYLPDGSTVNSVTILSVVYEPPPAFSCRSLRCTTNRTILPLRRTICSNG